MYNTCLLSSRQNVNRSDLLSLGIVATCHRPGDGGSLSLSLRANLVHSLAYTHSCDWRHYDAVFVEE